jgi:ribonuclease T2
MAMNFVTLLAIANAVCGLSVSVFKKDTVSCPADAPVSCSTSSYSNSCCFESPGGVLLATQFWDYDPATGPSDKFTLHGLWPDNCDGTYQQFCNTDAEISQTVKSIIVDEFGDTALYNTMSTVWKNYNGDDEELWQHEYNKHGTCINTLDASCYIDAETNQNVYDFYRIAVELYNNLDTYSFLVAEGIVPSTSQTYTKDQIQSALNKHFGGNAVYFSCDDSNALLQVWYFHHVKGSVLSEDFIQIPSLSTSGCSNSGIKWVPKGTSTTPTTTTTTTKSTSTSTNKGTLALSGKSGCLISNGQYYESGTCATITMTPNSGGYTFKSSKGFCAVDSNGDFGCASGTTASVFSYDSTSGQVGYNGISDYCLDSALAHGSPAQTPIKVNDGSCGQTYKLTFN